MEDVAPLPPGVYQRRGSHFYVTTVDGKQKWINLGKSRLFAIQAYENYVRQNKSESYINRRLHQDADLPVPENELMAMLKKAKANAKARGLECRITLDDLFDLSRRSKGECELTGIKFRYGADRTLPASVKRKRIWAPSIDRIDSSKGYTPDNVRLVCFSVNAALQEFGDKVLLKIATALSNKRGIRFP